MSTPSAYASCGKIVRQGRGDRYSHTYCDYLPAGHDGECLDYRNGKRMLEEWSRLARQILATEIERAAPSAPPILLTVQDAVTQAERSAYFAVAQMVREA